MRLCFHRDAAAFAATAEPWLARHEAEHNLPLGLVRSLAGRILLGEAPLMATVDDEERLVAVLVRTPPHNLVLSRGTEPIADWLVAELRAAGEPLPGVVGPADGATRFAAAWSASSGQMVRLKMRMTIHELTQVVEPIVPGTARLGSEGDLALAVRWFGAFSEEATGEGPPASAHVARALAEGRIMLWCDPEPVSLAGQTRETPRGATIAPVYTPPELRGRGYASGAVAALCARILAGGKERCFLFADQANPTANHLYQRLGFRPVATAAHWTFGSRGDP